jgi:hypothetical protein
VVVVVGLPVVVVVGPSVVVVVVGQLLNVTLQSLHGEQQGPLTSAQVSSDGFSKLLPLQNSTKTLVADGQLQSQ